MDGSWWGQLCITEPCMFNFLIISRASPLIGIYRSPNSVENAWGSPVDPGDVGSMYVILFVCPLAV